MPEGRASRGDACSVNGLRGGWPAVQERCVVPPANRCLPARRAPPPAAYGIVCAAVDTRTNQQVRGRALAGRTCRSVCPGSFFLARGSFFLARGSHVMELVAGRRAHAALRCSVVLPSPVHQPARALSTTPRRQVAIQKIGDMLASPTNHTNAPSTASPLLHSTPPGGHQEDRRHLCQPAGRAAHAARDPGRCRAGRGGPPAACALAALPKRHVRLLAR